MLIPIPPKTFHIKFMRFSYAILKRFYYKCWVSFINYGLAECRSCIEIQLTLNYHPKNKKVYSIFSKIAGMGSAHNIFQYNNFLGANSHAVCVIKLSLLKQATAFYKRND